MDTNKIVFNNDENKELRKLKESLAIFNGETAIFLPKHAFSISDGKYVLTDKLPITVTLVASEAEKQVLYAVADAVDSPLFMIDTMTGENMDEIEQMLNTLVEGGVFRYAV